MVFFLPNLPIGPNQAPFPYPMPCVWMTAFPAICHYNQVCLYTVKPWFIVFIWGLKKKRWIWKTIDVGAYIKLKKTIRFSYMYLLNQKTYTSNVIASTVKSTLHYFFLRKSLIIICLVAPFLFKLNNKLPILTMFAWSLLNTRDRLQTAY
jgi:hypothetical protein